MNTSGQFGFYMGSVHQFNIGNYITFHLIFSTIKYNSKQFCKITLKFNLINEELILTHRLKKLFLLASCFTSFFTSHFKKNSARYFWYFSAQKEFYMKFTWHFLPQNTWDFHNLLILQWLFKWHLLKHFKKESYSTL